MTNKVTEGNLDKRHDGAAMKKILDERTKKNRQELTQSIQQKLNRAKKVQVDFGHR